MMCEASCLAREDLVALMAVTRKASTWTMRRPQQRLERELHRIRLRLQRQKFNGKEAKQVPRAGVRPRWPAVEIFLVDGLCTHFAVGAHLTDRPITSASSNISSKGMPFRATLHLGVSNTFRAPAAGWLAPRRPLESIVQTVRCASSKRGGSSSRYMQRQKNDVYVKQRSRASSAVKRTDADEDDHVALGADT